MSGHSRREFLRSAVGSAAAGALTGLGGVVAAAEGRAMHPARGLRVERRRLGKTDMDVSALGFGGAEIGYERTEQSVVDRLLNSALDAGLNVIDTAECYVDSEGAIGRAVSHRRKDFWLLTKVGHWPDNGWTRDGIARSVERSLERLRTDHLDLVQLHSCPRDMLERGEVIEALEEARKAGKTRYIGYSGDRDAALYAVECGRFDTLQTSISIVDQEAIDLTLPGARERNMGVIVKRPIGNAVWRYDAKPENAYVVEYWNRLQALRYDFCFGERAGDAGPQGAAGIALRFTLSLPGVHTAIVGTSNPDRFASNARLVEAGALPPAEVEAIRARWKEVAEPLWVGQT